MSKSKLTKRERILVPICITWILASIVFSEFVFCSSSEGPLQFLGMIISSIVLGVLPVIIILPRLIMKIYPEDLTPGPVVDLGLSVKWGSCNIGASKPEDAGDYFAWGETSPKPIYDWGTYSFIKSKTPSLQFTKYSNITLFSKKNNDGRLEKEDDVAYLTFGENWHIPTESEFAELVGKCSWEMRILNGVKGFRFIGPNGNCIFLPAAGHKSAIVLDEEHQEYGYYWSASFVDSSPTLAHGIHFYPGKKEHRIVGRAIEKGVFEKFRGMLIRPVSEDGVLTHLSGPVTEIKTVKEKSVVHHEENKTLAHFCSQCGIQLSPDAKFCPSCGARVVLIDKPAE